MPENVDIHGALEIGAQKAVWSGRAREGKPVSDDEEAGEQVTVG
jgi:hypothetical protein